MHTDDDIFESLNIDGESGDGSAAGSDGAVSVSGTEAPQDTAEGTLGTDGAGNFGLSGADVAAAEDDIFEDLDIGDKIYNTAMLKGDSAKTAGAQHAQASGGTAGGAKGGSGKTAAKHHAKELNTPRSSVDRSSLNREKEKKKKSRIKKIVIGGIVEALTLCAIFVYGYFLRNWNLIARPEVKLEAIENNNISMEKKKEMEGYWNVAVFGVDGRSSDVVGRGLNSDVIIIASINRDNGDIKLVSVFRDTYLNISEKNSYNKINQAYAIGGPEQALAALNKNLDLNITSYVTFNWHAVAEGINILGGVDDIPISSAELYYINAYITETVKATGIGSVQLTSTGEQHLDGIQAVAYGRLRYMDNDFARTERQRNIIKACFEKAKTADFSVLNNIMVVCFPQVATNINFNDVVELAQNITSYNIVDTGGFPWSRDDANIGSKGDCVVPTTLESNVIKLHEFLFGDESYTPSDAVLSYSEKIKSDSNLYKEGKIIESVGTDGGVIQKPKSTGTSTGRSSYDDDDYDDEEVTLGVDDDGNYIYPTDEDGNIIIPTDEDGEIIYPTDEDGNIIRETRPTELSESDDLDLFESDEPMGGDSREPSEPGDVVNTNPTREGTGANTGTAPAEPATGRNTSNNTGRETDAETGPGSGTGSNETGTGTAPGDVTAPGDTGTGSSALTYGPGSETDSGSSQSSGTGTDSGSTGTAVTAPGETSSGPVVSTGGPGSVSTGTSVGPGSTAESVTTAVEVPAA